ncbi:MAG: ABC transporter ATP-binding protein [Patescibacteria group bacterium]
MNPLSIQHVSKIYKTPKKEDFLAVDDISLTITPGSIHGLLGPNGAGKSTLISLIAGMSTPTEGSITLFGTDVIKYPEAAKGLIGVVPQEVVVEMAFTVQEVLYYFSGMYGVPQAERQARIDQALEDLQLTEKKHEKAKSLSGGMKRRLMIAKAILHQPKLLILDEPTAGVDVALRQKIWELVRRLNASGTTVLFTTHYLEEAEQLCDSITLVNRGKVIKEGNLKDIQQEFSQNVIHFELFNKTVAHPSRVVATGSEFEFPMTNLAQDMNMLTAHYGDNLKNIRSEAASLEHIFLTLTK